MDGRGGHLMVMVVVVVVVIFVHLMVMMVVVAITAHNQGWCDGHHATPSHAITTQHLVSRSNNCEQQIFPPSSPLCGGSQKT